MPVTNAPIVLPDPASPTGTYTIPAGTFLPGLTRVPWIDWLQRESWLREAANLDSKLTAAQRQQIKQYDSALVSMARSWDPRNWSGDPNALEKELDQWEGIGEPWADYLDGMHLMMYHYACYSMDEGAKGMEGVQPWSHYTDYDFFPLLFHLDIDIQSNIYWTSDWSYNLHKMEDLYNQVITQQKPMPTTVKPVSTGSISASPTTVTTSNTNTSTTLGSIVHPTGTVNKGATDRIGIFFLLIITLIALKYG